MSDLDYASRTFRMVREVFERDATAHPFRAWLSRDECYECGEPKSAHQARCANCGDEYDAHVFSDPADSPTGTVHSYCAQEELTTNNDLVTCRCAQYVREEE